MLKDNRGCGEGREQLRSSSAMQALAEFSAGCYSKNRRDRVRNHSNNSFPWQTHGGDSLTLLGVVPSPFLRVLAAHTEFLPT